MATPHPTRQPGRRSEQRAARQPRRYRLSLEGHPIEATCRRSRGVRMIADSDGSLRLSVPCWFSELDCQIFVETHRDELVALSERAMPKGVERAWREALARLDEGDGVPLWGVERTVRLSPASGRSGARLEGGLVILEVAGGASGDGEEARAARRALFERLCRRELAARLPAVRERCEAALGVSGGRWTIRRMRSRWGSCNPVSGNVSINLDLATHDPACLDYIAFHEVCHRIHPDHSRAFYELLDGVCPGWRDVRRRLDAEGIRLA